MRSHSSRARRERALWTFVLLSSVSFGAITATAAETDAPNLCSSVSRGATPIASSCAAVEIAARPDLLLAPVLARLTDLVEGKVMIAYEGQFDPALADLRAVRARLEDVQRQIEGGQVCRAAETFEDAALMLGSAHEAMDLTIAARRRFVARTRLPAGDVSADELEIATLELNQALAGEVLRDVLAAEEAVDRTCAAIAGELSARGIVTEVDDEASLFRLDDGTLLALADSRGRSTYVGESVAVRGVSFRDGTGIATSVEDVGAVSASGDLAFELEPCLTLRIAPIQPTPDFGDPWTLHYPRAYEEEGMLRIEQGMRFGAAKKQTGCKFTKSEGKEYSLRLEVDHGYAHWTLTTNLKPTSDPVSLPSWLKDGANTYYPTLTATLQVRKCTTKYNPIAQKILKQCDQAVDVSSKTYALEAKPDKSYAAAVYDTTEFGVADDGTPGNWEPAHVVAMSLSDVPQSSNPAFAAKGRKIVNVTPTQTFVPIAQGDAFAVYESGLPLISARVVGQRAGYEFWYSASLPPLQLDKIADCPTAQAFVLPPGPQNPNPDPNYGPTYPPLMNFNVMAVGNTYYELPFSVGVQPWTGLMNIDDANAPGRHPEWQAYAFDLGTPEGWYIRAARSGKVVKLEELDPWNWNDPNMPDNWGGIGNYIWVQHKDGSVAIYFHVMFNEVFPSQWQNVTRGEAIGKVGETGNASGPHVHFEVVGANDPNAARVRVRFEAQVGNSVDGCYIPRKGEVFLSTNG